MKKTTKQLLDDLLEDDAPPGFHTALMEKTLQSVRRQKRVRRLNLTLGVLAVAGIFAFSFREVRPNATVSNPIRQSDLAVANLPAPNPMQIVSAEPNSVKIIASSDSNLAVVQTSASDRPAEINDKQLFALLGDRPVALIHQNPNQAKLVFLNSADEKGFPVQ